MGKNFETLDIDKIQARWYALICRLEDIVNQPPFPGAVVMNLTYFVSVGKSYLRTSAT